MPSDYNIISESVSLRIKKNEIEIKISITRIDNCRLSREFWCFEFLVEKSRDASFAIYRKTLTHNWIIERF